MGFEWDPKVLQLFRYCGKPQSCIPADGFAQYPAETIAAHLMSETPARLDRIRQSLKHDFQRTLCA